MAKLGALAAAVAVGAALAAPTVAPAATVQVDEALGSSNEVTLVFVADPGEANRLTVTVPGEAGDYYDVRLLDTAASLSAGTGCNGGGAPGTAVECKVHKPDPGQLSACGKYACQPIPGSAWKTSMRFALGNGSSVLDAGAVPPVGGDSVPSSSIPIAVTPGDGDDTITTSSGPDTIQASLGDDTIHTGAGDDTYLGGPLPDGADEVDLGPGRNRADYQERRTDITYRANALADDGSPGEGDKLLGVADFFSGSGDDTIEGDSAFGPFVLGALLYGGPGNDLIRGGVGDDLLTGGSGDDTVFGEGGNDEIELNDGNDTADGGPGEDTVDLGSGDDRADGGSEGDRLFGGEGDDTLDGAQGDDRLVGAAGTDALLGGPGNDRIIAGTVPERFWESQFLFSPGPIENVSDLVDCGEGADDRASIDRRDRVLNCDKATWVARLELFGKVFPANGRHAAQLQYLDSSPRPGHAERNRLEAPKGPGRCQPRHLRPPPPARPRRQEEAAAQPHRSGPGSGQGRAPPGDRRQGRAPQASAAGPREGPGAPALSLRPRS